MGLSPMIRQDIYDTYRETEAKAVTPTGQDHPLNTLTKDDGIAVTLFVHLPLNRATPNSVRSLNFSAFSPGLVALELAARWHTHSRYRWVLLQATLVQSLDW